MLLFLSNKTLPALCWGWVSFFLYVYGVSVYALSSDGKALLLLLKNLSVPASVQSSWDPSHSTPCLWHGIRCDHKKNVVNLNLSSRGISGTLGEDIGWLNYLKKADLGNNTLSGLIPKELSNCSHLKVLDLSKNAFAGEIPRELGMLHHLRKLHLFSNHLTGEIPISVWKIPNLNILDVHDNNLSGELPSEMTKHRKLKTISLSGNRFSGVIPQGLGMKSSLEHLDLSNNQLSGEIPPNLCSGKRLAFLDIGLNLLQGGIPSDIGSCPTLSRLTLEYNNLSGSLPNFHRNIPLFFIDISGNQIDGTMPSSLGNCTNLTWINLSKNRLVGLIPRDLGNLKELQLLNLSHNNLQGPLPSELISHCNKLYKLDVSFNSLNGSIPSGLSGLSQLASLILNENHFTGKIPNFSSNFKSLQEMQLGGNFLEGSIPPSIGNLKNIEYGMNLSGNRLTGQIPSELLTLSMLQRLDISHNNLTGSLKPIEGLVSLFEMNVSYNLFVGPVPQGLMKFFWYSPSSYLGNPALCIPCYPEDSSTACNWSSTLNPCPHHKKRHAIRQLVFSVMIGLVSIFFVALLLLLAKCVPIGSVKAIFRRFRRQAAGLMEPKGIFFSIRTNDTKAFLSAVLDATDNLNERYIIGSGAQGTIYKASVSYGLTMAVKKIMRAGEVAQSNMFREIRVLHAVKHRNLVQFHGFALEKDYALILTEFVENGSLHKALHDVSHAIDIKWNLRYRIALGTARALAYLHNDCVPAIVHGDIKPKNILLDSDMEPRITDFGISRIVDVDHSRISTLTVTGVGTFGYIAPESAFTMVKTKATDVYSYGVTLLELITGKKPLDSSFGEEAHIVSWVHSTWNNTKAIETIADPKLREEFNDHSIIREVTFVLFLALKCTDKRPNERPSMREVEVKLLRSRERARTELKSNNASL